MMKFQSVVLGLLNILQLIVFPAHALISDADCIAMNRQTAVFRDYIYYGLYVSLPIVH